jgi:amidase
MLKRVAVSLGVFAAFAVLSLSAQRRPFTVVEASITDMREALEHNRTTSTEIVTQYLTRIATYDNRLHATLAVNPDSLEEAMERDRERAAGRIRGPLHGIPVAVKDNIHTTNMPTTGGALAFVGFVPPYEATLVTNLKAAGAIILAKTGMTELANFMAGAPTPMPTNYNAVGGFGFNPYDPRRDPRTTADGRPVLATGGSSSGIGTATSFWAANVGTETNGSILSPSNQNMLAGIKPTVGRVSRYGVIPISADQDTPGPMAKSVTDAAIVFGALEGRAPDPNDAATHRCTPPAGNDYTVYLKADALKGARIGIPRTFYYDRAALPGRTAPSGGLTQPEMAVMAEAIQVLRGQGAVIIDPADIPSIVDADAGRNVAVWPVCANGEDTARTGACSIALNYGMKRDFNTWLATLGSAAPVKSLTELRDWNLAHQSTGSMRYGQARLDLADQIDLARDRARYDSDRAREVQLNATHGIDEVMKAQNLDALLFPGSSGSGVAARPGYPTVIVPFATVPNTPADPFPSGFDAKPAPFGVSFTGSACSEPRLLALAYAFEQATKRRVPPPNLP